MADLQSAFRENLTAWLKSQASLIALVSDRIFPVRQPQGSAFPELSWWITGGTRHKAMDGPVGISMAKVRFDCRGDTVDDADAVADAVRGLDGFPYRDGDDRRGLTANGMRVQALIIVPEGNGADDTDQPNSAGQAGIVLVSVDARITYVEPTS